MAWHGLYRLLQHLSYAPVWQHSQRCLKSSGKNNFCRLRAPTYRVTSVTCSCDLQPTNTGTAWLPLHLLAPMLDLSFSGLNFPEAHACSWESLASPWCDRGTGEPPGNSNNITVQTPTWPSQHHHLLPFRSLETKSNQIISNEINLPQVRDSR